MNGLSHKKNNTRVLLICPPYERLKSLSLETIPMGLLYVATTLKNKGYEVKVFDADTDFFKGSEEYNNYTRASHHNLYVENVKNDNHPAWVDTKNVLEEFKPDFVGVTMMTPVYSSCQKLFKIIKQQCPQSVLLVGGPHLTLTKNEALENNSEIDFGFHGEAEESIIEFMDVFFSSKNFSQVQGLFYRKNSKVIFTGNRQRIDNVDKLPIPQRSLLYNFEKYHKRSLGIIMASRGCPYCCSYCASVPLWGRNVKIRSAENVLKEIDYLVREFNILTFSFWDDIFTINKKNLIEFCRLLVEKYGSRKFKWQCLSNINCIDDDILRALKSAGCRSVSLGVESGSDRILKIIRKSITTDRVKKAVKLIKSKGLWVATYFMVGIPQETEEDIRKTINLIKELNPDSVNVCTFTPYVGTELYDYVVKNNKLKENDFSIYEEIGHHSYNNFFVEGITRERYSQLLNELLKMTATISKKLTLRKIFIKRHAITPHKIKQRIRQFFKNIRTPKEQAYS